MDGGALEHVALGPGRDADHGEGLAAVERRVRLRQRVGADRHFDGAARVQRLHDASAQLAEVVVDDRDRDLAQDLVEIGLRVKDAVDQRRNHQQDESATDRQHAPPLGSEGAADAARHRGGGDRCGSGCSAGHAPRDHAQAEQRKQRVEHGKRCQRRERARGFGKRQSARRLPQQNRHVPAHRQDCAPGLRERVHPERGKADAGVAERRRDDEARQAETSREVAHQKLHQRAQCQIADDQQRRRNDDHRHIAFERDPEQSLQNERHRQHDDEENPEQRRELARQRHDRVAACASEPGAHAAAAELGAHRIAGGNRDDHVQHHRQQRAQQKLGVVPLRVDQNDGLGDERADARCFRRRRLNRRVWRRPRGCR